MNPPRHGAAADRLIMVSASAAACALIGRALLFRYGAYDTRALACVLAAGVCGLAAVGLGTGAAGRRVSSRWETLLACALAALAAYQVALVWTDGPFHTEEQLRRSQALLSALVLGAALAPFAGLKSVRIASVALITASMALLCAFLLTALRPPFIDVIMFQDEGARALLSLSNPYALRLRNIYGHSSFYGSALVDGDTLRFGFPYPPVSLLLSTAAYAVAGDHRWAQAAAIVASGLLMGVGGRRFGALMAAVLFTTPRGLFVLECGWSEPFAVACLAAVAFLASRDSRWKFPALGLFWAVKQYLVLTIPLAWLLLTDAERRTIVDGVRGRSVAARREALRLLALLLGPAALITIPFVLWNPERFWFSVVTEQLLHPFRPDALSALSFWAHRGTPMFINGLGFLACAAAAGVALWRAPRSVSGFCASTGLALLAFFVFNKQAFANYYYLVLGCFAIAAAFACAGTPHDGRERGIA